MPKIGETRMPTALGVHIFAGGFSLGVRRAGFRVLAHLEGGKYGVSSARLNWPDLPIHIGEDNWPLNKLQGKVDFSYHNPPCAIWSPSGISTTRGKDAWRKDPRTNCWYQCLRVFQKIRPRFWVTESVTQAYTKGRELIDKFTTEALGADYSVKHVLMDAQWTGIPQSRRRFFLIFHRPEYQLDLKFNFSDPPTVGEVLSRINDPGHITIRKKRSPLKIQKMYNRLVQLTPPGEKLRNTFDRLYRDVRPDERGKIPGRPGFLVYRLHPNRVMGAFVGDVFIHPSENRLVGTEEMRALCGYPLNFQLAGPPSQHAALMARAVLPPVGEWLGRAVQMALSRRVRSEPTVTLIDLRYPGVDPVDLTGEYDA